MEEIWKDIPNYEGIYQVSNIGNVKSLKRIIKYRDGRDRPTNEIMLKPSIGSSGYRLVVLKSKTYRVHQLVAMAFLGHVPCGYKLVVDHVDNNRLNNRVENLEIVTHRENCSRYQKNTSSKYTGVCWDKSVNKWVVRLRVDGKRLNLGSYRNEKFAAAVYQSKLNELKRNIKINFVVTY
jgi:hypothetical protein